MAKPALHRAAAYPYHPKGAFWPSLLNLDELNSLVCHQLSETKKGKYPPAAEATGRFLVATSLQLFAHHVVGQHLPVVSGIPESLSLGRQVFSFGTRKTAIILDDSGPLFERVDVRYGCHGFQWRHGNPTFSTISRFCSSLIPAE